MRFVAGCATGFECRLVQVRLLHLLRLIAVARETGSNGIRLQETWRLSGVRVMAGSAVALRTRMLNSGFLNLFCLLAMAGNANRSRVGLRQDNLAVLRWLMAGIAHFVFERVVCKGLQQLR